MRPQHGRRRDRQKILEQIAWVEDCLGVAIEELPRGWFNEPDPERCKANVELIVDYACAIRKTLGNRRPLVRAPAR